ncbi:MAG TPA: biotin/lipoyl-containing protein, partial [Agromyces sp.]|nr:biotin/lipoyl-containing protein [Agromyces sp.]
MATVVRMPAVLTGITEAAIQVWLVEPGQEVGVGTPLAEVETEKAVVEYAAESAGTVLQLLVEPGASVSIGDPIAVIGAAGESVESVVDADVDVPDAAGPDIPAGIEPVASQVEQGERRFASPIVRRLAREQGIDLSRIVGSGPSGRIVRRDLEAQASGADADTRPAPPTAPEARAAAAPAAAATAAAATGAAATAPVPTAPTGTPP